RRERGVILGLLGGLKTERIEGLRHEPMLEVERCARCEIDGVLPPFGPQPQPILATERVEVSQHRPGDNQLAIDPTETAAALTLRRARHDTALPRRSNSQLGSARL